MKKTPAYLGLAFVLTLAACATPEVTTTSTDEPSTASQVPPTAAAEPRTETNEPPTETQELPTLSPEPSTSETTSEGESANTITVSVVDSTYLLQVINIAVGTTVTWEYDAGLPHTVTSDSGRFDSGTLGERDTFSYTFDEAGIFPYFCRFHGSPGGNGMSGVVNVTES